MESIRQTQKKYCSRALTLSIIICVFCIAGNQIAVGKGLILGTVFSILNFILMGEALPHRLGKSKKKTFIISIGSIYFRYLILAIPIVIAIKFDQFNLFSAIAGIFAVQIVILGDHLLTFIATMRRKKI